MVVKVKEPFEKTRQVKNNDKSKKYFLRGKRNTRYHERILSKKINLIISILFLIQHNFIISRLVVYKPEYDISRKGSHFSSDTIRPTPTTKSQYYKSQGIKIFYSILLII